MMNNFLQTVRKLYLALVAASAICTIISYFIAIHFCCQRQTSGASFPRLVMSLSASTSLNSSAEDRGTDADENELNSHLQRASKTNKVLVISFKKFRNEVKANLVYTIEPFPDSKHKVKPVKRRPGFERQRPYRGFFFAFSFTGDQLSAATRRLFKLNALAIDGRRLVVEPLVKDSSFFGDQLSRRNPPLKPLSLYYDMNSLNELLQKYNYARFASRKRFLGSCRRNTGTLYVRLFPNAWLRSKVRLKPVIQSLVDRTRKIGWMKCNLPLNYLRDFSLMKELRVVRQICVNTDSIRNFSKLEDEVLMRYKCVVFHHWSGTGETKGNYFLPLGTKLPALELTHFVPFSSEIVGQARRFVTKFFGGKPYISVHIRTERFFRSNPNFTENFANYRMCSEFLVMLVGSLKISQKINQVFLASDLGQRGSKAIEPVVRRVSEVDRAEAKKLVQDLVHFQDGLIQRLGPVVRKSRKYGDKGVEALLDMSILKDGDHLVTMGTGLTWQLWLIDVFKQRQGQKSGKKYSVVKLC